MKLASIALVLGWTASPSLAQSCFAPESLVNGLDGASTVAFADLDGDGDLDMGVIAQFAYTITLFWNSGDGTWGAQTVLDGDSNMSHLDFADLDGDGDADLVYTRGNLFDRLCVRPNLGGRDFGAIETHPVSKYPKHFVFADLDNDFDLDIVLACSGGPTGGTGVAMILNNQSNGTFIPSPGLLAATIRVDAADFDVDGDLDIALLRESESSVYIARNDGQGAFPAAPTPIALARDAHDLAAGDFDGDGRPDLAVGQAGNRFSILISTPGGHFAPYVEYATPHGARRIDAGDFDEDGDLDLAVVDWVAHELTVFTNAGNGVFAADGTYPMAGTAMAMESGDVDGDGHLDLAVALWALDSVRVMRNCAVTGVPACFGDGSATACPCGNASPAGARAGCLHSLGAGGTLRASGSARISADSIVLHGASMPSAPALYFQGTGVINWGLGSVFGDGLRCAGGAVRRLGIATNVLGVSQYPGAGQPSLSVRGAVTAPGERHYQVWYRNAGSFCAPATFNMTNSLLVTWRP